MAPRTLLGVRHNKAAGATSAGESSDAVAFGQLFGRHAQAVYTFCARLLPDSLNEDGRDALDEQGDESTTND